MPTPLDQATLPEWELTAELNGERFTVCMTTIEETARRRYRTHAKNRDRSAAACRSSPTSRWVVVA
jgi:hypothetical protein